MCVWKRERVHKLSGACVCVCVCVCVCFGGSLDSLSALNAEWVGPTTGRVSSDLDFFFFAFDVDQQATSAGPICVYMCGFGRSGMGQKAGEVISDWPSVDDDVSH